MKKSDAKNAVREVRNKQKIKIISQEIDRENRMTIFVLNLKDSQTLVRLSAQDLEKNCNLLQQCTLEDIRLIITAAVEDRLNSELKSSGLARNCHL